MLKNYHQENNFQTPHFKDDDEIVYSSKNLPLLTTKDNAFFVSQLPGKSLQ